MCGQVEICVLEVPYIVSDDEPDGHIRPDHVGFVLILGCKQVCAACHTEDVDKTCDSVEQVPPSAVDEYALVGSPPCAAEVTGDVVSCQERFHIGNVGDHDIGCNDEPGPPFEPVIFAKAPFVLDHHETYASDVSSVKLEIVEPAVHDGDCGVVLSTKHAHMSKNEVDRKDHGDDDEDHHSAGFCPAADFIHNDQSAKYQHPAQQLHAGVAAVELK